MTPQLRSPSRLSNGIRSSFQLEHEPGRQFAAVREIPTPTVVLVDEVTGTLRARWERIS